MKKMIFLPCFLALAAAHAADLKAPFSLPSARVLPKGVRNFSYKNVMAGASDKYNNSGTQVTVGDPFFKNITYYDIIEGKKNSIDKASVQSVMDSVGASENDKFAETIGQVNIKAMAHVPVFAYGVSSKTTLAVAVPILQYSLNVDTGVIHTNRTNYENFLKALQDKEALLKGEEFIEKMNSPITSKFADYGYEPLANEEGTILGDIKLVGKQKVLEDQWNTLSLQTEVTLPTGKKARVNRVINVTGGDGQTDLGLGVAHDFAFMNHFTLSSTAMYTVQFADKEAMRVPDRRDSKATPDVDPTTRRNLGDSLFTQVGVKWNWSGINLATGYSFQYKEADTYKGNSYRPERYTWMSQDTRQDMQSVQFSGGYDTIELFRQGRFKAPLAVIVNYTMVTSGKNVVKDPVTSLDFSLFF